MPPHAGFDTGDHLTILSSTFLLPKFFENLRKIVFISTDNASAKQKMPTYLYKSIEFNSEPKLANRFIVVGQF